jgi:hypothetical protein
LQTADQEKKAQPGWSAKPADATLPTIPGRFFLLPGLF